MFAVKFQTEKQAKREEKPKKGNHAGGVTPHRGKWWVRVTPTEGAQRKSLGLYETKEEAEQVLEAALAEIATGAMVVKGGKMLRGFAEQCFDDLEAAGMKTVEDDRYRFRTHITKAKFIDWPLAKITEEDVEDFVIALNKVKVKAPGNDGKTFLSHQTKKHILGTLRRVLRIAHAPPHRYIPRNPAEHVRVTFLTKQKTAPDQADYLSLREIERLREANQDDPEIWIILFALGTSIRQGEQWALPLRNVHVNGRDPHVLIEYGDHGTVDDRTKSGNTVKVPLFGLGLEAANTWLKILPTYARSNPHGLMFPGKQGGRRTKAPTLWYLDNIAWHRAKNPDVRAKRALERAGIERNIRWHDLRHTAASAWLSGYWGRRFTLQEVSTLLNHTDIKVTQRYAKFAESAIREAAEEANDAYVRQQREAGK